MASTLVDSPRRGMASRGKSRRGLARPVKAGHGMEPPKEKGMSLRESLQQIYDLRGKLDPQTVLEVARDPGHPLHSRFEWDDTAAAEQWRRQQAHELIRSVTVVYRKDNDEKLRVRQWHSISSSQGWVFEPLEKVAADPLLKQIVLRDAERQWKDLHARYSHLEEFILLVQRDLSEAV